MTGTAANIAVWPGIVAVAERQSVVRGDSEVLLSRTQFRLFALVARAKHGITPERIFDALYGDDPRGGPDTGHRAVCTQRTIVNRKLRPLGIEITTTGRGRAGGFYELKSHEIREPHETPAASAATETRRASHSQT
jgi:DNA-binding response OmpR family regulator